jgi:transposase-like protein
MQNNQTIIRYSEAFKQQVIREFESGNLSRAQLRRKYGIGGVCTIGAWIKKYGSFESTLKVIRVEKPDEKDQILALKEEIKRLKQAIADEVLDRKIAESTLEVLCEDRGWDVEEVKKKAGIELQKKQQRKKKK